jgi:hypothetical protein
MNASAEPVADPHDGHAYSPREWGLMAIGTGGLTTLQQAADAVALRAG